MAAFEGKVAIVTGASSGIGKATALILAERGATVVVAARRTEVLDELVAQIEQAGGKASAVVTDVAQASDVEAMVAHAVDTHGRLDLAVNNAGIGAEVYPLIDTPDDYWDRVMAVNLRGNFLCLKHEARAMLAFLGCPGASTYTASKAGQLGLTTSASAELAEHGIRVNLLCPGVIHTPLHEQIKGNLGAEAFDGIRQRKHMRRFGEPEEIARCIAFLCSEDASFVTGTTLTPDGGFHLSL